MHDDLWTPEKVAVYLEEAADTLKRLPAVNLKPKLAAWPDVVRSSAELYFAQDTARNRPARPSPKAIDQMDVVLTWLLPLPAEERRILWARALGVPWRKLEDMDGRSHVTLRKIQRSGLDRIVQHLSAIMQPAKHCVPA